MPTSTHEPLEERSRQAASKADKGTRVHKHINLQAEFRALVEQQGQDPATVTLLEKRIRSASDENLRLRAQLRESRTPCSLLKRQLAVQAPELASGNASATVTPLTGRRTPTRPAAPPGIHGTDRPHA